MFLFICVLHCYGNYNALKSNIAMKGNGSHVKLTTNHSVSKRKLCDHSLEENIDEWLLFNDDDQMIYF